MNTSLRYLPKNHQRNLFVFATVLFVLLTSCPFKSSIKSLANIPAHTEQGGPKSNQAFWGNGSERCAFGERREAKIFQTASLNPNNPLPAILLTATSHSLPGNLHRDGKHSLYGKVSTASTLPLFLRYRKLVI